MQQNAQAQTVLLGLRDMHAPLKPGCDQRAAAVAGPQCAPAGGGCCPCCPLLPPAGPLPDLPCGLTRLVLTPEDRYWPYGWSRTARYSLLQQDLSQLRTLELCNVGVHASGLSSMSQLQQLVIDRRALLPRAAPLSTRVSALLAVVGELTLLHELKLVLDFVVSDVEVVPSAAFSALTASSQLRVLHFELSHATAVALPGPDVLQHMFPAGWQLGQLNTLVLGSFENSCSQWDVPQADLALIAASCQALQTLSLVDVFEPGDENSLRPVMDLTVVSSLRVGGAAWDDSAAGVVAQLTQLTSLEWVLTREDPDTEGLSCAGLMHFAALQRLQVCNISAGQAAGDSTKLEEELGLLPDFASSDQSGPVWIQIHRLLGVPEFVLQLMLQRQQQHEADMQELQRCRVAELEHRACAS